jgi:recombination protein RecA
LAVELGVVQKSGAWFNLGEIRLGQGRDNAKTYLAENPETAAGIEAKIRENASELLAVGKKKRKLSGGNLDDLPPAPAKFAAAPASERGLDISADDE